MSGSPTPNRKQVNGVSWIAVHDEVRGSKLRGLRKEIKCSEAEALGILTILWLWARCNANAEGLLANTDREDIAKELVANISKGLDADVVVDAIIKHGYVDDVDGQLYVHDWYEWQSEWYNYLDKREKDRQRKRAARERQRAELPPPQEQPQEAPEEPPKQPEEPPQPDPQPVEKPKKPEKTKYADNVRMFPEEVAKLQSSYGEEFTAKLIEELDNYKGATGKKYKDDYRAILNWVVEKCEKKYPQLKKKAPRQEQPAGNPFAEYR